CPARETGSGRSGGAPRRVARDTPPPRRGRLPPTSEASRPSPAAAGGRLPPPQRPLPAKPLSRQPPAKPFPAKPLSSPLPQRQQIREQPVRPGHALRELPEEREPGIHVGPLPVLRYQDRAPQRALARVAHLEDGRVTLVPG